MSAAEKYCIIGGGPSGIAVAKCLRQAGIPFEIVEREDELGGNWYFGTDSSRVYDTTHLISSKLNTQFSDFPMPNSYPAYPHHRLFLAYLRDLARHFRLYDDARLRTEVVRAEPEGEGWRVDLSNGSTQFYKGVVVANGLQRKPRYPRMEGTFKGDQLHSAAYRGGGMFSNKRVLIIGGGNSGCDIAVDAVSTAARVLHSTRRPYYYMPKFVDGRPTQEWLMDLPRRFPEHSQLWEYVKRTFKLCGCDPADYGLPAPSYEIYQAHPIMNSRILYHIGHGDITPKPDVVRLDGQTARFMDGSTEDIDVVLYATGYDVHFPFLSERHLDWRESRPDLFLYSFHRRYNNLLFMGFVNAAAGFGNVANVFGKLFASYLRAYERRSPSFQQFCRLKQKPDPELGQSAFIQSERHQFEVDLWKLLKTLNFLRSKLAGLPRDEMPGAPEEALFVRA